MQPNNRQRQPFDEERILNREPGTVEFERPLNSVPTDVNNIRDTKVNRAEGDEDKDIDEEEDDTDMIDAEVDSSATRQDREISREKKAG